MNARGIAPAFVAFATVACGAGADATSDALPPTDPAAAADGDARDVDATRSCSSS